MGLPAQTVDATQALNRSAGVWKPKVLRGRSLSCRATLLSCGCVYTDRSVPLGNTAAAAHWCSHWTHAATGARQIVVGISDYRQYRRLHKAPNRLWTSHPIDTGYCNVRNGVNLGCSVLPAVFPVYPRHRTLSGYAETSESSQKRTHAVPQNIAGSFEQCVGSKQERFWNHEADRLCSL